MINMVEIDDIDKNSRILKFDEGEYVRNSVKFLLVAKVSSFYLFLVHVFPLSRKLDLNFWILQWLLIFNNLGLGQ